MDILRADFYSLLQSIEIQDFDDEVDDDGFDDGDGFDDEFDDNGEHPHPAALRTDAASSSYRVVATVSPTDVPPEFLHVQYGYLTDYQLDNDAFEYIGSKLPKYFHGQRMLVELDQGYICARTVPQEVHETMIRRVDMIILNWANSSDPVDPPFIPSGSAGYVFIIPSANFIDYVWSNHGKKSPDCSYVPRDLTVPPAKRKLRTPVVNATVPPYPTMVVEIAHKHESWKKLKDDARRKAFSSRTSIHCMIGIKFYKNHFQAFWGVRRAIGWGIQIRESTGKLPKYTPTNMIFTIPRADFWWGVPAGVIPQTASPHFIFSLEQLRVAWTRI